MTNVCPAIEKYQIKLLRIIQEISGVQSDIVAKKGIASFSKKNPAKINETIKKLYDAKLLIQDAIKNLIEAGNN